MNGFRDRAAALWLGTLLCLLAPGAGAAGSRLDEIERTLRGQPEVALQALAPMLDAAQGEERIRALVVRGGLQQRMADDAGIEATARELDAMAGSAEAPAAGTAALAGAAAGLVRGAALTRQKSARRADRVLTEATAALPAATPDDLRLRFLAARAVVRQSLGKIDEAVALYTAAVALADSGGPPWRRAELRSSLAHSLFLAHQHERALALNAEAAVLARQAGDLHAQAGAANTDAIVYAALKRDADELRASEQAIALARQAGSTRLVLLTTANLADYYLKHGEPKTALELAQQALPLARQVRDLTSESVALTNSGLAMIALGRTAEGTVLVRQALLLEERSGGLPGMSDVQRELGLALEQAGHLPEAWAALVAHRRLSDEVFQRQHQQAVLELQEGLDAERRERELAALQTENRLKEAQLQGRELQQQLWALALLAGVLLLAAVGLLLRRMRDSNARLRHSNAQLKVASEHDPLTGLANRRHFQALMRRTAAEGFEGSLLLIDLDHFKRVNDRHGHAAGDAVLIEMARRLREALRERDLVVRWGGEEFLVVVDQLAVDQVEALAERLLATVGGTPVQLEGGPLTVTASIGFATFPLPPTLQPMPWERAVDVVDTALYLAKAHGRNRAYGVRSLAVPQAAGAQPASALESAWRDGQAELAHFSGPRAAEPAP